MKVTEVIIRHPRKQSNSELVCLVDVVLDDMLKLKDIQLCYGKYGYYISFPQRKLSAGGYYNIFQAIDNQFKVYLKKEILNRMRAS